jgi:hypothetical protein
MNGSRSSGAVSAAGKLKQDQGNGEDHRHARSALGPQLAPARIPAKPGHPLGDNTEMAPGTAGRDRPAGLQDELRYLLNRWDPIGIYDEQLDFPPDEYDCLIGPLLTRLARHDSRASLSEYPWHEVEDHFGLDPVQCETGRFADRLLAWYAAKDQAPDCN